MADPRLPVILYGYRYSVYLRIVRMVLLEKGVGWTHVEINPFAETIPADYLALHPFGRVPTLKHGDFVLYETAAITRYVDEAFPGQRLQPETPHDRARMNQIIAVVDCYGYRPMVRQVFSPRVFNAALGRTPDESVIAEGIAKSRTVLGAIETLAARRAVPRRPGADARRHPSVGHDGLLHRRRRWTHRTRRLSETVGMVGWNKQP